MKHNILLTAIFFTGINICSVFSQKTYNQSHSIKQLAIDTLSHIQIDKVIYYKEPIEIEYENLADTSYIPQWYDAFCATCNIEHFKNYVKDAPKYFSKDMGITDSMLKDYYNQVKANGGTKAMILDEKNHCLDLSYFYVFGETWITIKSNNVKYLLIRGIRSKQKFMSLKFSQTLREKNIKNEVTDSIKNIGVSTEAFILDNDTLKSVDQTYVLDHVIGTNNGSILCNLSEYKDMLYRSPIFIQSEKINGKRGFKTMKKGKNGHQIIKESDKP